MEEKARAKVKLWTEYEVEESKEEDEWCWGEVVGKMK